MQQIWYVTQNMLAERDPGGVDEQTIDLIALRVIAGLREDSETIAARLSRRGSRGHRLAGRAEAQIDSRRAVQWRSPRSSR